LTELCNWAMQVDPFWGYVAVFLGSLIEGESVIFLAGFLAHEGCLSLYKIILISFIGTLFADQLLYHIGRHYGNHVIDRFPSFKPRAEKAFHLLKRYDSYFILVFRFIYGIRIISPIIIGSSGVNVMRFTFLNIIAAIIWSVGSCVVAYFFAHLIMEELLLIPKIILGIIIALGIIAYPIYKWRTKRNDTRKE
jgi:membrane protein DedA with SNARE-associated domain